MKITITFQHLAETDALKTHATERISKLQKFLNKPMTAQVTLSVEGLKHVAYVKITSGSAHFQVSESTEDMYSSIDLATDKLERQMRSPHPRR